MPESCLKSTRWSLIGKTTKDRRFTDFLRFLADPTDKMSEFVDK